MIRVLYEDNHLLVVDKPAEIATMGSLDGQSMHSVAADYLRKKYNKPGNVFVGIVSRLDSMTSGVLVLARTSKAASRLAPQFGGVGAKGDWHPAGKVYLAVVEGGLDATDDAVTLVDYVRKDDAARRMRVVGNSNNAQRAELRYHVIGRIDGATLIAVRLGTGRKHQIRVQMANRGHCVLGDRKYGSKKSFPCGIALHSHLLQIKHPTLAQTMEFSAMVPRSWSQFSRLVPAKDRLRETIANRFDLPRLPSA